MIEFSKKLKDEIEYVKDTFAESADEGETLSTGEALRRLMEDCDEKDSVASLFKTELRNLEIELGIVRPISQKEMDNTYVTRGKKYDFKLKGIYYVFNNWDALENIT